VKGTSLSKDTSVTEILFFENPATLSGDISRIVEKTLSRNVEQSFQKFLDPDPEADDFQNLISFSCKISSVVFT